MVDCCGCNVVSDVLLASFRVVEQAMVNAGFEYLGAGSNRNFCFTDLWLRECRNTDVNHFQHGQLRDHKGQRSLAAQSA